MSNVNIKRAVENIRAVTNPYTPLVEVIVNAIQAIDEAKAARGEITIKVKRSPQIESQDSAGEVVGFSITDNGIGFTKEHRDAFDTLYTAQKIAEGGKGFGRFTCLKYFSAVQVESRFKDQESFKERRFSMGLETDIIVSESVSQTEIHQSGSTVTLSDLKKPFPDRGLETIARTVVERLLPYFLSEDHKCPSILLQESDGAKSIDLNLYVTDPRSALIQEVKEAGGQFTKTAAIGERTFFVRVFKIYSPRNQRSRVSLVAHRREVSSTSIQTFVPEFAEEFYDTGPEGRGPKDRNFVVRVYVFGEYLDENVSLERSGFEFQTESDMLLGVSQREIESAAAEFAKNAVGDDVKVRQERKRDQVHSYVHENAPWYREALLRLDLSDLPYNPTEEQIETKLHYHEYKEEVSVKREIRKLLESTEPDALRESAAEVVRRASDSSKNELAHYVALRRGVLQIFEKSLATNADGSYSSEDVVHDIIFPRKKDSESAPFESHNLWIIDERLNFTEYLSSDLPLNGRGTDRPDIIVYDRRIGFRGDNEPTNPVVIFEFKKPQRDDFVNPSSKEDPVQQIVRYVRQIRNGEVRTRVGREIQVAANTPFFGYVVCDLTPKVREWAEIEKDFKPMPDRLGYFYWHESLNLYTEILSWDKLLKDATMRNRVFFHKLGLE